MELRGKVTVEKHGRSGQIRVVVDGQDLQFTWEFGGGNCIARVEAPDPERWLSAEPHRKYERTAFLAALAQEIARLECPRATIEIGRDGIYFYEPGAPG